MRRLDSMFLGHRGNVCTLAILLLEAVVCTGCMSEGARRINVRDLGVPTKCEVIGVLGRPVCQFMTVRATIVEGPITSAKDVGFLLEISHVDGTPLDADVRIAFRDLTHELPEDIFALAEAKSGKKTGSVSAADRDALTSEYLGSAFDLRVYETFAFLTPAVDDDSSADGIGLIQGAGYGVRSMLVVCKVLRRAHTDEGTIAAPTPLGGRLIP